MYRNELSMTEELRDNIWDGLEVRITEKERSVFSVKDIEKETLIPYGGFEFFWERYSEVTKIDSDCVIVNGLSPGKRLLIDGEVST